jgi:DNA-binding beta-propeller fold protein YncE
MKKIALFAIVFSLFAPAAAMADSTFAGMSKHWTYSHTGGQVSEILAFDDLTKTLWVAGVVGVDVLNASNGSLIQHIDTTAFGSINSVAVHNGIAAFAIESSTRTNPGVVKLYDTTTRALASGVNSITVGALPDMVAFSKDGSRLLVANEGTPSTYGAIIGTTVPKNYGPAAVDPVGSVSIIDMATRSVVATPDFASAMQTGSNIRTNTGMDFEPEYIAINDAGTKAYVVLQEANAIGVIDMNTNTALKVMGLGVKDFSVAGNEIDPKNDGTVNFVSVNVKGLYMPDGISAYDVGGENFLVMANEGDFREDDGDRSTASTLGATGLLSNLRVSNTDSSPGNLYAAGARSFSIRDADGNLVYDSGSILDREARNRGIYDDVRSRDKGVEPEGVDLMQIGGRTYAFIGLERTTKSAVAIFDITNPAGASFIDMIVTDGDRSPEGLEAFTLGGQHYLAISNEVSNTTTVWSLAPVPEPETWGMLLAGIGLLGFAARRRKAV